ncbi:MAG: hypothetical protein QOF72_2331 [Blastocatellia bacterium]|jgi:hypothetical protein|nr:hypothetical protein [Blastocatellia bacterium]
MEGITSELTERRESIQAGPGGINLRSGPSTLPSNELLDGFPSVAVSWRARVSQFTVNKLAQPTQYY